MIAVDHSAVQRRDTPAVNHVSFIKAIDTTKKTCVCKCATVCANTTARICTCLWLWKRKKSSIFCFLHTSSATLTHFVRNTRQYRRWQVLMLATGWRWLILFLSVCYDEGALSCSIDKIRWKDGSLKPRLSRYVHSYVEMSSTRRPGRGNKKSTLYARARWITTLLQDGFLMLIHVTRKRGNLKVTSSSLYIYIFYLS